MLIVSQILLDVFTFKNRKVTAMALWPIIIFKDKISSIDPIVLNHEKIHHRQQLELLLIPYYIWYFTEYWWAMFRNGFKHDKAYRAISFEKEAFAYEKDLTYLQNRPFLASLQFIKKRNDTGKKN